MDETPANDLGISVLVEIARTSGLALSRDQRRELDGLIAEGLVKQITADGPLEDARYAVTPEGQKLLDDRGVGANES